MLERDDRSGHGYVFRTFSTRKKRFYGLFGLSIISQINPTRRRDRDTVHPFHAPNQAKTKPSTFNNQRKHDHRTQKSAPTAAPCCDSANLLAPFLVLDIFPHLQHHVIRLSKPSPCSSACGRPSIAGLTNPFRCKIVSLAQFKHKR